MLDLFYMQFDVLKGGVPPLKNQFLKSTSDSPSVFPWFSPAVTFRIGDNIVTDSKNMSRILH